MKSLFGPIHFYKKALKIALPVMFQLLIQSLISLIDNFMVSDLGNIKYSSVNVANQLNMIIFILINSITTAGGIYISQYNGTKDGDGMKQAYRFKILIGVSVGILYTACCYFLPKYMMNFMLKGNLNQTEITFEGIKYLKITAFTWVPIVISTCIGSSMRESENVKTPLYISIFATLVNTFFNWVFIYGNLGAPRLEIVGAGIATLIARVVELATYFIYCYIKKPLFFSKWIHIFKIKKSLFWEICKKLLFIILSEMSWILTETIMNKVYNGRGGSEVVAGMSAAWSIANLFQLIINGVACATAVIIGGTLGQGKLEEGKLHSRWMKSGAVLAGAVFGVALIASGGLLKIVFRNISPEAIDIAQRMLFIIGIYLPAWTYLNAQFSTARAGGDAIMGTVTDVSVNLLLFLPGILLVARFTSWGPVLMFAVLKLTDFAKIIVAEWQLRKERWVKNLTIEN